MKKYNERKEQKEPTTKEGLLKARNKYDSICVGLLLPNLAYPLLCGYAFYAKSIPIAIASVSALIINDIFAFKMAGKVQNYTKQIEELDKQKQTKPDEEIVTEEKELQ